MKTRIKLAWNILRGRSQSWVFFNISDKQQQDYLNGKGLAVTINYIKVDKRVAEKLKGQIEK